MDKDYLTDLQKINNLDYLPMLKKSTSWDKFFFDLCDTVSAKSKDPKTKVGSVIADPITNNVIAMGYNGFPREVMDTEERLNNRDIKLKYW